MYFLRLIAAIQDVEQHKSRKDGETGTLAGSIVTNVMVMWGDRRVLEGDGLVILWEQVPYPT